MNTTPRHTRGALPAGILVTPALIYPTYPSWDALTSLAAIMIFLAALWHTPGSNRPPTCLIGILTIGTTSLILWHHINSVAERYGADDQTAVLGPCALIGITIVLVLNSRQDQTQHPDPQPPAPDPGSPTVLVSISSQSHASAVGQGNMSADPPEGPARP